MLESAAMSQINPYPPIVVPNPVKTQRWPKKQGQDKSQQQEHEHEEEKSEEKKEGEGLDLKA